jgi:hypothetical protein
VNADEFSGDIAGAFGGAAILVRRLTASIPRPMSDRRSSVTSKKPPCTSLYQHQYKLCRPTDAQSSEGTGEDSTKCRRMDAEDSTYHMRSWRRRESPLWRVLRRASCLVLERIIRSRHQLHFGNRAIDLATALENPFMNSDRDEHRRQKIRGFCDYERRGAPAPSFV